MGESYFEDEAATLGDRLTAARETLGLTQAQLAQRLGVRKQTLATWEADRAEPRANRVQMLAGILNVSITWLLTGEGKGVAPPEAEPADAALVAALAEARELRLAQARLLERAKRLEAKLQRIATDL